MRAMHAEFPPPPKFLYEFLTGLIGSSHNYVSTEMPWSLSGND